MEGGSNIDGDESGGVPAGCRHRNSGPPKLVGDGGGDRNFFWRKGVWNQGFRDGRINRSQSRAPGGVGPSQEGRWRGQGLGGARHPPGCPLDALWPPFGLAEASRTLIFYIFSWDFSSVPKYPETCTKENSSGSSAENSVSPC